MAESVAGPERLLRASEVADVLGVARSTAYLLMENGTLPTLRIGRAVRVPEQRLQDWIAQQTQAPKTEV